MTETETEDVKEESSTQEQEPWTTGEVEETQEEVQDVEVEETESEETETEAEVQPEVKEEPPAKEEPRVPLSRLKREIEKRKALEAKSVEAPAPKSETGKPVRPKLGDDSIGYDEDKLEAAKEKYEDDLIEYKFQQLREKEERTRREEEAKSKKEEQLKQFDDYIAQDKEYAQIVTEIIEADEDIQTPAAVVEAINEYGFELDKHILKNRHELLPKLNAMSPTRQLMEVGRIIASIEAGKTAPEKAKAPTDKKKTTAPPVIKRASSNGSAPSSDDGWDIK